MHLILYTVLNLTREWTLQWISVLWCFIHPRSSLVGIWSSCFLHSLLWKQREEGERSHFPMDLPRNPSPSGYLQREVLFLNLSYETVIILWSVLCSSPHEINYFCGIILHVQNLQNLVMPCQMLWYGYCMHPAWHFQYGNCLLEMFFVHRSN